MVEVSYQLDDLEVKKSLRQLVNRTPALSRRILSYISEAVVNRTVQHHLSGQTLKRVTGTLAKSITYKLMNDWSSRVGTNLIYAPIHEFGGIIKAKNDGLLKFKIKDQWISKKEVVMPARPYLAPSLEYVMREEASDIMNRQINSWLKKEWEK